MELAGGSRSLVQKNKTGSVGDYSWQREKQSRGGGGVLVSNETAVK